MRMKERKRNIPPNYGFTHRVLKDLEYSQHQKKSAASSNFSPIITQTYAFDSIQNCTISILTLRFTLYELKCYFSTIYIFHMYYIILCIVSRLCIIIL